MCVIQECMTPLENGGKNCSATAPKLGECCQDTCECDPIGSTALPTLADDVEHAATVTPMQFDQKENEMKEDGSVKTEKPVAAEKPEEELPEQKPTEEVVVALTGTPDLTEEKPADEKPAEDEKIPTEEPANEVHVPELDAEKPDEPY